MSFFKNNVVLSLLSMKLRAGSLALKFLLTLFVARFLGLEDLGRFGLIMGVTNFSPAMMGFSIMPSIGRRAVTQTLEEITLALRQYMVLLSGVYIIVAILAVVTGVVLDEMTFCLTIAALLFLVHFNFDAYILLICLSRQIFANVLLFIRGGLWIMIYMPLAFFDTEYRTLEAILLGWVAGEFLAAVIFLISVRGWPWMAGQVWEPMRDWMRQQLHGSRMLYFTSVATTIREYLDRYLISILLGLEMTGVYVLFWTVSSAITNLLRTGILQFSKPKLIRAFREKSGEYAQIFGKCLKHTAFISTFAAVVITGMMYVVVPYLEKPLVEQWMPILWFVMVAFILNMIREVYALIFFSQHEDKLSFKFSVYMLVIALACNLSLIPFFGLWGAGVSLVVIGFAGLAVQYPAAKKLLKA